MYRQKEGHYSLLYPDTGKTFVLLYSAGLLWECEIDMESASSFMQNMALKGHFSTLRKPVGFCQLWDGRSCQSTQFIKAALNLMTEKVYLFPRVAHSHKAPHYADPHSWVCPVDSDKNPYQEFCGTVLGCVVYVVFLHSSQRYSISKVWEYNLWTSGFLTTCHCFDIWWSLKALLYLN